LLPLKLAVLLAIMEYGDLLALVGGPKLGQVHRTPTCPALSGKFVRSNRDAVNVLERTEV